MNTTVTRFIEIDCGHRLMKHESKCRNVHGHRYRFEVTCSAESLDEVGRVIDFSAIKEIVGTWLDDNWDHGMVVQFGDPMAEYLRALPSKVYELGTAEAPLPPTAENMSAFLLTVAQDLLTPRSIRVVKIRCYETPNCYADSGV